MASRSYNPGPKHPNPETVLIEGSFQGNGTSSPLLANQTGRHFTVARTGAGAFTITFADKFPALLKALPGLQFGTPIAARAVFGAYSASAKTLLVRVYDAAGAAVDLTSSDRFHFSCTFQNSAQPVK